MASPPGRASLAVGSDVGSVVPSRTTFGATVDASRSVRRRFRVGGRTRRGDAALATDDARINDRIRARQVRLIGADGSQLGVKPLPEALQIAREQGLDLVEVAANADPPVCKIMDYGKYKYEQDQRRKESQAQGVERRHQGDEVPPEDRRARLRRPR